jgi:hypothetical protein
MHLSPVFTGLYQKIRSKSPFSFRWIPSTKTHVYPATYEMRGIDRRNHRAMKKANDIGNGRGRWRKMHFHERSEV